MKKFVFTIISIFSLFLVPSRLLAQESVPLPLEEIRIPFFLPIDLSFSSSATVFSWLSFVGAVATILLVVFWIYMVIRASLKALQSNGEPDALQEASQRFRAILIGVILTFLVPVVLSIIGIFLGIGSIFQWPKMFSLCETNLNSVEYQYYYQVYLEEGEDTADRACNIANAQPGSGGGGGGGSGTRAPTNF